MMKLSTITKFALLLLLGSFLVITPSTESVDAQGSLLLEFLPINPDTNLEYERDNYSIVDTAATNGRINFVGQSLLGLDLSDYRATITVTGPNGFYSQRTERFLPFAAFGDRNGNYFSRVLEPGTYNLTAFLCFEDVCYDDLISYGTFTVINSSQ
ncbi:MAG: hypothetical protein AAF846_29805 [Chloroflexota bacterium]